MPQNNLISALFQDKANRYCADCNVFLSELHEIYGSFFPLSFHIDERWRKKNWIQTKYGRNFVELHESFAPEGSVPSTTDAKTNRKALTGYIESCRNDRIALKSITHGVFVCKTCAEVHSRLDANITLVKLTSDKASWSEKECKEIRDKGNLHGNNLLERFIPEEWSLRKQEQFENKLEREVFIRYKYEILDFLLPKERWGYKKFMKRDQTATKKWKYLLGNDEKCVDWAIYTLGYRDYLLGKSTSSVKKKNKVPLEVAGDAQRILRNARRQQIHSIHSIIRIQSFFRMVMVQRKHRLYTRAHNKAEFMQKAVKIQSRTRGYLLSKSFVKKKHCTVLIQARLRGRRIRLLYSLTKEIIIKIQAFTRGCLTRGKVHSVMNLRSAAYQQQIVNLWERTYTPMTYRTKFWMHTNTGGFTTILSQEHELIRLWSLLQFDFQKYDMNVNIVDESVFSNAIYAKYLKIESCLKNPTFQFPVQYDCHGAGHKLLETCAKHLQLERVQIYERLFYMNSDVEHIYHLANINIDEKFKKVKLAKSIWNQSWHKDKSSPPGEYVMINPATSASIFDELFPELRQAANITPVMPSKKGLERLGVYETGSILVPLPLEGTTMHFKSNLDKQIINNLADISRSFVKGVQHLVLTGTMNTRIEDIISGKRQLEAINSSKYLLIHRFVNKTNEMQTSI